MFSRHLCEGYSQTTSKTGLNTGQLTYYSINFIVAPDLYRPSDEGLILHASVTATFDNRRRAVNVDSGVAPFLERRDRERERDTSLAGNARSAERDGKSERAASQGGPPPARTAGAPCPTRRRPCAAPSPPGKPPPIERRWRRPSSFHDAVTFIGIPRWIPLSWPYGGAREKDRLTGRYNGNTRNSGSRSPIALDKFSLRLRLSPTRRSRTHARSPLTIVSVARLSAACPRISRAGKPSTGEQE